MNRRERRATWLSQHRKSTQDAIAFSGDDPAHRPSLVRVHIGELVLHGFPPSSRHIVGDAARAQLSALITRAGVPPGFRNSCSQPFVDAGSFQLAANAKPGALGSLIATAVYGGKR